MAESPLRGLKALWEKEKLLVTNSFSFSHSVFQRLLLQTRKNQGKFGKELNTIQSVNHSTEAGNNQNIWDKNYATFCNKDFKNLSVSKIHGMLASTHSAHHEPPSIEYGSFCLFICLLVGGST